MPHKRPSRLHSLAGIGVDRMGDRADLVQAPDVLRLENLPVTRPAGGWSRLLDGAPLAMTGSEMSEALLAKARIAATPMDGWGDVNGKQFVRFVFSNEPVERLRGIGERIRAALGG